MWRCLAVWAAFGAAVASAQQASGAAADAAAPAPTLDVVRETDPTVSSGAIVSAALAALLVALAVSIFVRLMLARRRDTRRAVAMGEASASSLPSSGSKKEEPRDPVRHALAHPRDDVTLRAPASWRLALMQRGCNGSARCRRLSLEPACLGPPGAQFAVETS